MTTTHRLTLDIHIDNARVTEVKLVDDKLILNKMVDSDNEIIEALIKEKGRLIEEKVKLRNVARAVPAALAWMEPVMDSLGIVKNAGARTVALNPLKKALAALPPELLKDKP